MSDPLREALIQIKTVCEDNSPSSCDQRMALNFVWQIATSNLAASGLPAPQPTRLAPDGEPYSSNRLSIQLMDTYNVTGDKVFYHASVRLLALSPPVTTEREYVDMLWNWFEERCDLSHERREGQGLTAEDFRVMLDEHEAAIMSPVTTDRAAVIEECAKIAESSAVSYSGTKIGIGIATKIRTLLNLK